ncbi:MAG: YkgJ family cysteine cluster protein [Planctomycetia bacterium]|nr:YkgJ family cysteine cluster protein [Planctomycetia bacterium]
MPNDLLSYSQMPPPLELPTIQNWSCHNCGGCCRQHAIEITAEERSRILSQDWGTDANIPRDLPLVVRAGVFPWSKRYRLGHQPDGACVFLDERGLCRIHAKFGEPAKPLACRIYPYAFHPAGKKITVSLRFSCPSVAANRGRSVAQQRDELKLLERLVVPDGAEKIPPPEISAGQRLDWNDTLSIVGRLDNLIATGAGGVALRLIRALKLVELIGQARFEKIRGPRLDEFLEIVSTAALGEAPADLADIPEPGRVGRMQFRLLCAQYARRDTFAEQNAGWRNRWTLFRAALRFTRGTGNVPALQPAFTEVPFADLEQPFGPLTPEIDEMLIRYLRVKLQGLHFCGRAYYNVPLIEGFQSLALVVPVVMWLARWLAAGQGRKQLVVDDALRALNIADHHHGYSPAFGHGGFRGRVRLLARLDDISKLAAWYSR